MRHAFDVAEFEGQEGLGALQGLHLALLIDEQHHRMVGRVEVEADDVAELFDEEGIGGELEVFLLVGLNVERGPKVLDRGLRHAGGGGHGTAGPVPVAVGEVGLERLLQQRHEGVSREGAGRPDRCSSYRPMMPWVQKRSRHSLGVQALGAQQHNLGAVHQAAQPSPRLEFLTRPLVDGEWFQRRSPGHGLSLVRVPVDGEQDTLSSSSCTTTCGTKH